jgi:hypothetical protein
LLGAAQPSHAAGSPMLLLAYRAFEIGLVALMLSAFT